MPDTTSADWRKWYFEEKGELWDGEGSKRLSWESFKAGVRSTQPGADIIFNPEAPIPYTGTTNQYMIQVAPEERTTEDLLRQISAAIRTQATHQRGGYQNETLLEVADAIDEVLG